MRLHIFSDLHLEHSAWELPAIRSDALVLPLPGKHEFHATSTLRSGLGLLRCEVSV